MWQNGLAEAAGVCQATISAIERGSHMPTLFVAVKIATALRVSLDSLLPKSTVRDTRRMLKTQALKRFHDCAIGQRLD